MFTVLAIKIRYSNITVTYFIKAVSRFWWLFANLPSLTMSFNAYYKLCSIKVLNMHAYRLYMYVHTYVHKIA